MGWDLGDEERGEGRVYDKRRGGRERGVRREIS